MKFGKISRRRLLFYSILAAPALAGADAECLEPHWVKVRTLRMSRENPTHRVVHFTDVHHKGDRAYLESVVRQINALAPDVVCFTGDLIEKAAFLPETLELLGRIKAPLYGVPGNHDYWSGANFGGDQEMFRRDGRGLAAGSADDHGGREDSHCRGDLFAGPSAKAARGCRR